LSFDLCAIFKTESQNSGGNKAVPMVYPYYNQNWDHGAGRVCFSRTIDPQLYKIPTLVP